jgi:hypothetical protein
MLETSGAFLNEHGKMRKWNLWTTGKPLVFTGGYDKSVDNHGLIRKRNDWQ